MTNNLIFIWLIALPILAAPVIYLAGRLEMLRLYSRPAQTSRAPRNARWLAFIVLLVTWIPYGLAAQVFLTHGAVTVMAGSIPMLLDGVSLLLAAVVLGLGTLVTLFSGPYMTGEEHEEKYYAMLSALIGVMIALGCAGDLFNLWVWFEGLAVTSYLLVVFYRNQPASLEAGVKYLVQSAVGSMLVLLGLAIVIAATGATDLARIHALVRPSTALLAAGALFLIGFGVKIALVPMHTWLPDAHTQAPSGISAMLSGVVIEAGLIALLRVLMALAGPNSYPPSTWGGLLMAFGILNMLVGNLMALRQNQVKRLLAFSSLSHVGYMMLGFGVALYAGQAAGAQGGFFHIINHGLMKGLAFLAAGALMYAISGAGPQHSGAGSHGPLTRADMNGAAQRYPLAALGFSVAVLGLGGLPPLAGFMSKWQIFVAGFSTQNIVIILLMIFAALNSVLSLGYYAPLVNAVYRKQPSEAIRGGGPVPTLMNIPIVVLCLAVIVLGIWPNLLSWLTGPAGQSLMAALGG